MTEDFEYKSSVYLKGKEYSLTDVDAQELIKLKKAKRQEELETRIVKRGGK